MKELLLLVAGLSVLLSAGAAGSFRLAADEAWVFELLGGLLVRGGTTPCRQGVRAVT